MSVDLEATALIARPRSEVARFATDPDNDTAWIGGLLEARLLTQPPLAEGARVARVATFLGKRIEYVNEVVELDPGSLLSMRSVQSPFPMRIRYEFEDAAEGTLMRIRVAGDPTGFFRLAAPLVSRQARRSVERDLATLKRVLERD